MKITLVTVFDQSGRQDLKFWRDVFSLKKQKRFDAYLISVGIPFKTKEQYSSMDKPEMSSSFSVPLYFLNQI